jgi:hypothetical protein
MCERHGEESQSERLREFLALNATVGYRSGRIAALPSASSFPESSTRTTPRRTRRV